MTLAELAGVEYEEISTHTLTWSVTQDTAVGRVQMQDFNSHAHVERDWIKPATFPAAFYFNSHAHVERDKRAV